MKSHRHFLIGFILLFFLGLVYGTGNIVISPADNSVPAGGTVEINVMAENVSNLYGFQFGLDYDGDILSFNNITFSDLLGTERFCIDPADLEVSPGHVGNITCIRTAAGEINPANGLLATITLNVNSEGDSILIFDSVKVSNINSGNVGVTVNSPAGTFTSCPSTGCVTTNSDLFSYQNIGSIIVDGNPSEWASVVANVIPFTHIAGGVIDSDVDASAIMKSMWDAQNLYIMVAVTDDIAKSDSILLSDDDSAEVFLDGGNEKGTSYDANDFQLIVRIDNSLSGNNSSLSNVQYALSTYPNGYTIEYSIPFTSLGITPGDGTIIGFDLAINDDDDGANRDGKIIWFPENDKVSALNADQDPSVFGNMELLQQSGSQFCGDSICSVGEQCVVDCGDELYCTDGVDNDADSNVDCNDSGCSTHPACLDEIVCDLTNAFWNPTTVQEQQNVDLIVQGNNCNDELVHLKVFDSFNDQQVFTDSVIIIGTQASTNWDPSVPGQYYFTAEADRNPAISIQSNNLTVAQQTQPEICDNFIDDDNDGFADCQDLECLMHPACVSEPVCEINNVSWSTTTARDGDAVDITVNTNNCIDNQLLIEIWEQDNRTDEKTRFGFQALVTSNTYTTPVRCF